MRLGIRTPGFYPAALPSMFCFEPHLWLQKESLQVCFETQNNDKSVQNSVTHWGVGLILDLANGMSPVGGLGL